MDNRIEILKELKKAIEFYQELGFECLPIKEANLENLLTNTFIAKENNNSPNNPPSPPFAKGGKGGFDIPFSQVSEKKTDFISNKERALKELRNEIGNCQLCKLSKGRKNIVFGEGNPDTELMFIGEGPGREEDLQARPFVGDAGKVLSNLIKKMELKREDVYIANIVKCRPPSNREPEEDEITACRPFVEKQIEIIEPKVIIALGKIAAQTLTGSKIPISKLRGKFHSYKGIPVMPTFHPAYLMRNPKDKWLTWEDAQKVLEILNK